MATPGPSQCSRPTPPVIIDPAAAVDDAAPSRHEDTGDRSGETPSPEVTTLDFIYSQRQNRVTTTYNVDDIPEIEPDTALRLTCVTTQVFDAH
jgi:hypothetical protein